MAIPDPEPGLVIHFNYLWRREQQAGSEEARYPRPCAIIVSYRRSPGKPQIVLLAPITHTRPRDGDSAIEIPAAVKAHLGLDDQPSWVMVDEVNETLWPGFDLRPNVNGTYVYGSIPPKLYARIKARILDGYHRGSLTRVLR